jgi:hypothetical protein
VAGVIEYRQEKLIVANKNNMRELVEIVHDIMYIVDQNLTRKEIYYVHR